MTSKKLHTFEEMVGECSDQIVNSVLNFLDKEARDVDAEFARVVSNTIIAGLVAGIVYRGLKKSTTAGEPGDQYKMATRNFNRSKLELQNAVAAGFQGAMASFSGKNVEYYCVVKATPEPINKKPC